MKPWPRRACVVASSSSIGARGDENARAMGAHTSGVNNVEGLAVCVPRGRKRKNENKIEKCMNENYGDKSECKCGRIKKKIRKNKSCKFGV